MSQPICNLADTDLETCLSKYEIVVIKFTAGWCQPCKDFHPIFTKVAEKTLQKTKNIIFVEADVEKFSQLATDFQIKSVPFLVILKSRVIIYAEAGTLTEGNFNQLITQATEIKSPAFSNDIPEEKE